MFQIGQFMRTALIFGFALMSAFSPICHAETGELVLDPSVGMPLPEGYPWKMGDATISLDGVARSYTTFDFSIGAFDAAVQFRHDYDCSGTGSCKDTGKALLSMLAHPDGNPDAEGDVVLIRGVFQKLPKTGKKTRDVTVEIQDIGGEKGKYLKSKGPAKLVMTHVKRGKEGSDSYGVLTAEVTATVCEATEEKLIVGGACQSFQAVFETEVQYDSI